MISELTHLQREYIALIRNAMVGIRGILKKVSKKKINEAQALIEIAIEQKRAMDALDQLGKNGI